MAESSALFATLPVMPAAPPSSARSQCNTQCQAMISGTRSYKIAAMSSRKSLKFSKQLVDLTGNSDLQALPGTSCTLDFCRGSGDVLNVFRCFHEDSSQLKYALYFVQM